MAFFGDTEQMGPVVSTYQQSAGLLRQSSPRGDRQMAALEEQDTWLRNSGCCVVRSLECRTEGLSAS